MGITESRQTPRRLPFTSKWTHPQAEAAILPLWCQALPHLCGHRAAAHSLHTDIHHSSWRMCRLTHKCAYFIFFSLCRCTLVVMERQKTLTAYTHTHPQCYHLVEMKYHWRQEGQPSLWEGFTDSREWHPLHSGYLFLLYGTKCHLLKFGFTLFLSKQKPTHWRDEGQCGCAAQLTPIWASSKRIDNRVTENPWWPRPLN